MKKWFILIPAAIVLLFGVAIFPSTSQRSNFSLTMTAIENSLRNGDYSLLLTQSAPFLETSNALNNLFATPNPSHRNQARASATARPTLERQATTRPTTRPSATRVPSVNNATATESNEISNLVRPLLIQGLWFSAYWFLALALLFALAWLLNKNSYQALRLALNHSERHASPLELAFALIYRSVIILLLIAFYLSLALLFGIIFLAGLNAALVFWGSPLLFAAALALVAVGLYRIGLALYHGLFTTLPLWQGRRLRRDEAPELWKIVQEVAEAMGTRSVDFIYIAPAAELGVWETGGLLQVVLGAGNRNLLLGIDALAGLSRQEFKAALAHEYGHFLNRDTSLGGFLSLRILQSIELTRRWLIASKRNHWANPIWVFLQIFSWLFIRVSFGAAQLQEVLADRSAAMKYGAKALSASLQVLIMRQTRFAVLAQTEINRALRHNQPIPNLYTVAESEEAKVILKELLGRAYVQIIDSHPPAVVRFAFMKKLEEEAPYQGFVDASTAGDLLLKIEDLQAEMMKQIEGDVMRRLLLLQYLQNQRPVGKRVGR